MFTMEMRRGAAVKIHGKRTQAGKMESYPISRGRRVQDFFGKGAEILYEEPVAARRKYAAAGFMAGEFFALKGHGLITRVDQPLSAGRRGGP
jgi:hypothetical protein